MSCLIWPYDPERQYGIPRQTQTWVQILALTSAAGKSLTGSASLSPSVQWTWAIYSPGPLWEFGKIPLCKSLVLSNEDLMIIVILRIIKHLLRSKYGSKCFTINDLIEFTQTLSMKEKTSFLCYRWGAWGVESVNNLSREPKGSIESSEPAPLNLKL